MFMVDPEPDSAGGKLSNRQDCAGETGGKGARGGHIPGQVYYVSAYWWE
jgi:hypothetical protein